MEPLVHQGATTGASSRCFTVREHYEARPRWRFWDRRWAGWWAESDDVPGWTAAATTENDLRNLVFESLREMLDIPEGTGIVVFWEVAS